MRSEDILAAREMFDASDFNSEDLQDALADRCCEYGPNDHGHTDCWLFALAIGALDNLEHMLMGRSVDLATARGEM